MSRFISRDIFNFMRSFSLFYKLISIIWCWHHLIKIWVNCIWSCWTCVSFLYRSVVLGLRCEIERRFFKRIILMVWSGVNCLNRVKSLGNLLIKVKLILSSLLEVLFCRFHLHKFCVCEGIHLTITFKVRWGYWWGVAFSRILNSFCVNVFLHFVVWSFC